MKNDSQAIKYRVIGALVVITCFLLAWWLLLDHDIKRGQTWDGNMPEPLVIERFDIDASSSPLKGNTSLDTPSIESSLKEKPSEKNVTEDKKISGLPISVSPNKVKPNKIKSVNQSYSKLDEKGLPEAWVLQIASFQEKSNAEKLQKKLLADNLSAYIKSFDLPTGKSYRVLVGPQINKAKAEQLVKKIEAKQGLKSMIIRYKPGFSES